MTATTADGRPILWSPQPKQAAFLSNPAFEVLGGGSAFGGKSSAILAGMLRQVTHPRYRGLIVRRTFPELRELMDRAMLLYGPLGATWHEQSKRWTFPSGATVEFGFCIHGDTPVLMADGTYQPMASLCVGDFVQTLEGARRVTAHWFVGERDAVSIRVDGHTTYASATHELLTADGRWATPLSLAGVPSAHGETARKAGSQSSQGAELPPLWTARLAQHVPARPLSASWGLDNGYPCDGLRVPPPSALQGFPDGYRPESRCGDGPVLLAVEADPTCILPQADAAERALEHTPEGDPGNTRGCSPWGGASYCHPYTKEDRPLCEAVRDCLAEMAPAGVVAFYDMMVEDANHYITKSGIVHKNCEAYRDVMRYQGQEFTVIAWDELTQCPEERIWLYLMSRCRSGVAGLTQQMLATTNPGGPGHAWVKRRFVDVCPPNGKPFTDPDTGMTRAFVQFGLKDNAIGTNADPTYERRLQALPETERRQLLDGDWTAGDGAALSELAKHTHLVPAFTPDQWAKIGPTCAQWVGYDWGYAHPAVAVWCVKSPSGIIRVRDTLWMRRMRDDEMADKLLGWLPALGTGTVPMYAGGDVFAQPMARTGDVTPRTSSVFRERGIQVNRAPIQPGSRKRHLSYLRKLLAWKGQGHAGRDADPLLVFEETPGNKRLFDQLEGLVTDPDDPEDVLKIDATDGVGGDDGYDALRYALAGNMTAVMPEVPKARHEDMAQSITQRREKRDGVSSYAPTVLLPPPSIASGWDADTYEEIRA